MRLRAIPALRLYPGGHRSSPRAKRVVSILTRWLFVLVPAVGSLVAPPLHGAVPTSDSRPVALKPGEPLVRQISRGEVQTFSVQAQAGHFLYLLVEQQEVDVAASLSAPDGRKLLEVDNPNGPEGPEVIALAVRDSGNHTLSVTTSGEGRQGRYTILLEPMRPVTRSEEQRLGAETHFAAAEVLRKQDSADALRGAAEKYEAALAVWRESEDRIGHARALIGLGFVLATLDEHDKAIATFQNALETSISANLVRGQASIWTSLGTIHDSIGEKQKALDAYEKAVPLWRSSGYLFGLAETINSIGLVHDLSGDRPRALEHYREALGYFETLGDSRGQAFALSSIARAESELGDTQRSLQTYVRALSLVRRIGERRGEAAILTSIGLIYGALGERQQAIRYFEQAVPLRKEAGDRRGEAATYTGLGKTHLESGDPEKARDYYTRALALSREVKDPRGEGVALTRLGSLYEALGDMERALDHHWQALRLRENLQDRTGAAFVLARIGSIHESRGELERARESFQKALELSREVRHDVPAAEALLGLARLARGRGDLDQARSLTEQALERIESLRARVTSPDLRASYLSTVRATFELYTDLLMELHRRDPAGRFDALALVSSERARARSLLELLSESRTEVRLGVDPQLLARERELKQRLSSKADRQVRLLNSKHTAEQAAVASKEIDELAAEIDSVQASIRAASPRYAALTQPLARSVEEIQADLDPETALLEFSLGERRSFLWVVRAHSLESFELPGRLAVEKLAGRVYRLLTSRNERVPGEGPAQRLARVRRNDEEYLGAAAELSRMLFPEGAELAGLRRLAVVADGALQYLPFSALPMRGAAGDRMPLLVESHEVINLPSASVLSLLRSDSKSRPAARNVLAVIADPVFDRADERVLSLAGRSRRPGAGEARVPVGREEPDLLRSAFDAGMGAGAQLRIPRLPFSRREAERILSLAPLKRRKRALDFDASRSVVVSGELARYRIVHFATHGILNTQRPELSGLVLSLVDRQGRDQPGFLTAAEVFNLELGADLVVLSGCRTALGRELQGEGLIGLTRGFMYAGAPRVVASLWKVEDAATAELMARFYRGMLGPERLRPAAALRAAQGSMRKVPRWSLPYYWAGFVLQGEWQ